MAWEITLAFLIVAVIVSLAAGFFGFELWLADRVLPGVHVWDVDLSGLTRDQATERLTASFYYPANLHPTLRHGNQAWAVSPADLGARLDVDATVDAALAVGHHGDLKTRLEEQYDVLLNGRLVMPLFTVDPGAGVMFLGRISRDLNRPARNASLVLGDNLGVQVVPGQTGREVDELATQQSLIQRITEMVGGEVELVVHESEPLLTDLSAARETVQHILDGPIVLTAPDLAPWTIDRETLAGWLILQPTVDADGGAGLSVSLDSNQIARFVQDIAPQVAREPTDASFSFDIASETVVPVVDSIPGRTLDVTTTVSLIESAATRSQRTISLPLDPNPPAIATSDAPDVGSFELLGEGKTSFAGSTASRVQNIVVGAARFDGLLVPPDKTFSFNRYLGEVTAEQGYAESIIIWGNETRADVGGGLCQVSTTAFRAAFWAGLPITERWAHLFRVSYYEPPKGLDATIYSPTVDLRWVNDTGHFILIRTYVDKANKTLTFRFYGINPGRTVEMDGPHESRLVRPGPTVYRDDPTLPKGQRKQIEWAKDGLDVTVHRIIKEDGEEVRRDTFFSRYRPWQAVYLVGTKEE